MMNLLAPSVLPVFQSWLATAPCSCWRQSYRSGRCGWKLGAPTPFCSSIFHEDRYRCDLYRDFLWPVDRLAYFKDRGAFGRYRSALAHDCQSPQEPPCWTRHQHQIVISPQAPSSLLLCYGGRAWAPGRLCATLGLIQICPSVECTLLELVFTSNFFNWAFSLK